VVFFWKLYTGFIFVRTRMPGTASLKLPFVDASL